MFGWLVGWFGFVFLTVFVSLFVLLRFIVCFSLFCETLVRWGLQLSLSLPGCLSRFLLDLTLHTT